MKKGKTKCEGGRRTIYHSIYHYICIFVLIQDTTRHSPVPNKWGGVLKTFKIITFRIKRFPSIHPFLMAHSSTYHNKNEIRGWVFEIREEKMKILEKIGVGV